MKKPNIVIFNPDQMRADAIAHLGNPASITPNIDAFAHNDAVSFRNAFCQNTVCVPSRCSFFTGLYPHVTGHRTQNYLLHDGESSLLKELKDAGWYVWMNRRNDLVSVDNIDLVYKHCDTFFLGGKTKAPGPENPNMRGELGDKDFYSMYRGKLKTDENGKNYTADDEAVDEAINVIKNRPDDRPFCVFLGLFYPHSPYQVEEPYFSAIDREKLPKRVPAPEDLKSHPKMMQMLYENLDLNGFSQEDWDRIRTCYLGMCMKVDEQFGRLCDALKKEGIYDDTDIYFLSDHGDFTGDYNLIEKAQNLMPDCLTNVPLLIKPHKGIDIDPGVTESLAELVDFYATAIDLAGVEPDHNHYGHSLRPVLKNRNTSNREFVCTEGGRNKSEINQCSETGGKGLPKAAMFWPRMTAQLDDVAHNRATMLRNHDFKYIRRLYEEDEFYDLKKDPKELKNEINNPEYINIIGEMKIQMLEWYQETCDIVPKKIDSSLSKAVLFEYAKNQISAEDFQKFENELGEWDGNIGVAINVCEKYGVNIV